MWVMRGVFSCVTHNIVSYNSTKILVRCARRIERKGSRGDESGSPWYIAGLEKWFRQQGIWETSKCSLRFGWRRIAFQNVGCRHASAHFSYHPVLQRDAFVTGCIWLARGSLFASPVFQRIDKNCIRNRWIDRPRIFMSRWSRVIIGALKEHP